MSQYKDVCLFHKDTKLVVMRAVLKVEDRYFKTHAYRTASLKYASVRGYPERCQREIFLRANERASEPDCEGKAKLIDSSH